MGDEGDIGESDVAQLAGLPRGRATSGLAANGGCGYGQWQRQEGQGQRQGQGRRQGQGQGQRQGQGQERPAERILSNSWN